MSSPSRLPALPAAYKKYGSPAESWRVSENQRWSVGLAVVTAKNGAPTQTSSTTRSHAAGAPWPTGDAFAGNRDRQGEQRGQQHAAMHHRLVPSEQSRREMGVAVTDEQDRLKEDEGGDPDRARATEDGQDELRRHRLHEEDQRRPGEGRGDEQPDQQPSRAARQSRDRCGYGHANWIGRLDPSLEARPSSSPQTRGRAKRASARSSDGDQAWTRDARSHTLARTPAVAHGRGRRRTTCELARAVLRCGLRRSGHRALRATRRPTTQPRASSDSRLCSSRSMLPGKATWPTQHVSTRTIGSSVSPTSRRCWRSPRWPC